MPPISRGFGGRRRREVDPSRVPPGQYVVDDFPVLSAGPDPAHADRRVDASPSTAPSTRPRLVLGRAARRCPPETFTVDIHCVTKWTKLGTTWTGVSVDTLLEGVETEAEYLTAWCDGDYTTNLTLEDITDGKAWVAYDFDGEPLEPEHGGPARLLVPHLYFWKSAKWVRGLTFTVATSRASGRPRATTTTATRGGSSATGTTDGPRRRSRGASRGARGRRARPPRRVTLVLDVDGWPGHVAGQHLDVRLTAEDGYQAQRSYSIASAPEDPRLELTVERLDDGEVSPYLAGECGSATSSRCAGRSAGTSRGARPTAGRCCWWRAAPGWCR